MSEIDKDILEFNVHCYGGNHNFIVKIHRLIWESMNEIEKKEYFGKLAVEHINNKIDCTAKIFKE